MYGFSTGAYIFVAKSAILWYNAIDKSYKQE
jgi:hypothetical protein